MRSLTLGVLSVTATGTTNRCDDTVQDNCFVADNQDAQCKEFLSSAAQNPVWAQERLHCILILIIIQFEVSTFLLQKKVWQNTKYRLFTFISKKRFLKFWKTLSPWTKSTKDAAATKCDEEGGRLMKVASLSDLSRLGSADTYKDMWNLTMIHQLYVHSGAKEHFQHKR